MGKKSKVETWLGAITEVHAGEGAVVLLLSLNFFLLLGSYYIIKAVREALILSQAGAEAKSYAAAGQALLLLFIVPAFSVLASRLNRTRLLGGITGFFALNLVLFSIAGHAGRHEGVAYFLWVGIFNVMAVAQFWAFANDLYTPEQGKRLFAIVGLGASLGAWVGARAASVLIPAVGTYSSMLVAAAVLVVCALLVVVIDRRQARRQRGSAASAPPLDKGDAFKMVLKNRYLLLIAGLVLLLNIVNTTGEYLLGRVVTEEAQRLFPGGPETEELRSRFIGEFYGKFFANMNMLGILLQAFATARLMKFAGVAGTLAIAPLLSIVGYVTMLFTQSLVAIRTTKVFENSYDYSASSTARQALFLVTTREEKYKAKTAIDTFIMRAGDVISAEFVALGSALKVGVQAFAAVNIVICGIWLLVVAALARENRRRAQAEPAAKDITAGAVGA